MEGLEEWSDLLPFAAGDLKVGALLPYGVVDKNFVSEMGEDVPGVVDPGVGADPLQCDPSFPIEALSPFAADEKVGEF